MSREIGRALFENDVVKFNSLIAGGVDINSVTNEEGWNLLHRSLITVSKPPAVEMVKHLVVKGVDVSATDCYGNTPLHYAARLKMPELVEVLLDAGSQIDAMNLDGVIPLRESLLSKPVCLAIVELLLSRGANMNHSHQGGATVLEYAKTIVHGADAELLEVFRRHIIS
jgi:uncharacterized protein